MLSDLPPGTYATSTLVKGKEGSDVTLQWIKQKHPKATRASLIDEIKAALKGIKPLGKIPSPKNVDKDLLCVYPMGDPHLGQYSWAEETGDDYDLAIAEQLHVDAMDNLVSRAPFAAEALIVNIGDYLHANDHKSQTPQSHHSLDVDTRHRKVLSVATRVQERQIRRALQKHKRVTVINVAGNHDPESHLVVPFAMEALFRDNPRVVINNSPSKFHYYRHGLVLLGATHGDTVKIERLGELMANDQRKEWGETSFHHWFMGHLHHRKFFEGVGFSAEVLRTLAGKDAYAASHAYRSLRDMQCVVFHKLWGEYERYRADVSLIQKAA